MRGWLALPWRTQAVPISPLPVVPEQPPVAPPPKPAVPDKTVGPKTVLVTVLGLEGEALVNVIETVTAECKQARTRPLFVTEASSFAAFRAGRSVFEQVIDPEVMSARRPELDWRGYVETQYRLIGRKWKPVTTIAFGRPPDPAFVQAVLAGAREKL